VRIGLNQGRPGQTPASPESLAALPWPEGTQVLRFEDLEGAILLAATLTPKVGRDTSGVFLLDTGAGFVAVDFDLARLLGIADSADSVAGPAAVGLAASPLARLQLGGLQVDQVYPVQTVDAGIVRRVTGRPVLGLLGQALFRDRVVVLDYREGTLVVLPPEAHPAARSPVVGVAMSPAAVAVPFRLAGDGKALVTSRVFAQPSGPRGSLSRPAGRGRRSGGKLTLVVDTGATKTFFFRAALDRHLSGWTAWPSLRGLGAPTLTGDAGADFVRVDRIELGLPGASVARSGMDAAVLGGGLGKLLASDVGESVDGLLGYSFLKHFRVALDYPRGLLWLDPARGDVEDRPGEYCHPGLQLESVAGVIRIMAVAEGSPAALEGIRAGDELVEIDGDPLAGLDLVMVSRRLEGAPGTALSLRLRRGSEEWVCRVVRRRLL
jgi:predicted aspartyl protease